jgi:hypothetical protein
MRMSESKNKGTTYEQLGNIRPYKRPASVFKEEEGFSETSVINVRHKVTSQHISIAILNTTRSSNITFTAIKITNKMHYIFFFRHYNFNL